MNLVANRLSSYLHRSIANPATQKSTEYNLGKEVTRNTYTSSWLSLHFVLAFPFEEMLELARQASQEQTVSISATSVTVGDDGGVAQFDTCRFELVFEA